MPLIIPKASIEFFHKFAEIFADQGAPPVSLTLLIPVYTLTCVYFREFCEKNKNDCNVIISGLGKVIHEQKPETKNLVALPHDSMSLQTVRERPLPEDKNQTRCITVLKISYCSFISAPRMRNWHFGLFNILPLVPKPLLNRCKCFFVLRWHIVAHPSTFYRE
jgi:hypothetical protein